MWTLLVAILAVIEASEATAMGTTNEPDIPCCGKQKVRLDELQMLIDDCSIKYRKVRVDWERSECVFECLGRKKAVLDKQGYFNKGGLVKIAESFFTDPDLKSYAKELTTKLEPKVNFTAKQLKKRRRRCNPAFLVGYINTRRLIELKCPKEMKNEGKECNLYRAQLLAHEKAGQKG